MKRTSVFHVISDIVRVATYVQYTQATAHKNMSTFQREIQIPLKEALARLNELKTADRLDKVEEAVAVLERLTVVREQLRAFEERASRPDSPYGDNMKEKIREAVKTAEESIPIAKSLHEAVISSRAKDLASPSVQAEGADTLGEPALSRDNHNSPGNTALPQLADAEQQHVLGLQRIAEAALRIKEMEEQRKAEERIRQLAAADEERQRRDQLRVRQEEEAKRSQAAKLKEQEAFNALVTLGRVNHVHSVAEFHAMIHALGNRAYVVDWFANWCGP